MQKIAPFLWFNDQAEEAMTFYTSLFENSKVGKLMRGGPDGAVVSGTFQIEGQEFMALNGGPHFTFSPAVSFFVQCETAEEVNRLYGALSEGGEVLMPLDAYPFSQRFSWVNDRFGVSWQLILAAGSSQKITPFLMFTREQHGKAEEAMEHYVSIFENARMLHIENHGAGEGESTGTKRVRFTLAGQEFMALDGGIGHAFTFTPAISFFVNCKTQEEVDELWDRLSQGGEVQQCGWLKDKFGVSWQIIPAVLGEMLSDPDPAKSQRVMQAMLQMVKIDIAGLKQAYGQSTGAS